MNKSDVHPPLAYPPDPASALSTFLPVSMKTNRGTTHRLIVLVPDHMEHSLPTQRIRELARATDMSICLLGLCKETAEIPRVRQSLVTMTVRMPDPRTFIDVKVARGANWVRAVRAVYEAGDVIVCFTEQHTGLLHRSLSQVLESSLNATVYVLTNPTLLTRKTGRLARVRAWLVFIGIMLGFGLLQVQIVRLPAAWPQSLLLILSTLAEFWLIWIWNRRLE